MRTEGKHGSVVVGNLIVEEVFFDGSPCSVEGLLGGAFAKVVDSRDDEFYRVVEPVGRCFGGELVRNVLYLFILPAILADVKRFTVGFTYVDGVSFRYVCTRWRIGWGGGVSEIGK